MSSFLLFLLVTYIAVKSEDVSPTVSNATGDFYVTSEEVNFQFDTITCSSSYCHIQCNEVSSCYGLSVDATSSNTLIMECFEQTSCYQFMLDASPSNTNIYCHNSQSCYDSTINAGTTQNLYLECTNNLTSTSYATCGYIKLNADNSLYPTIKCNNYNCYYADFNITNSYNAQLIFNGAYGGWNANIYANNIRNNMNIQCNGRYACNALIIYSINMIGDLSLICNNERSCSSLSIYASHIDGSVTAQCNGLYSCNSASINTQQAEGGLTVNCIGQSSCYYLYAYCPVNASCDINCTSTSNSVCQSMDINVNNQRTDYLNLECSNTDSSSCSSLDIICRDTSAVTDYAWDSINTYWECSTYGCCPITTGNITCAKGAACQIDCSSEDCVNKYINAKEATSLYLDCNSINGCEGAQIIGPSGDYTSMIINCTQSYSCRYAYISTATDNILSSFVLDCGGSYSCQYSTLILQSTSISNLDIICSAQSSSTTSSCIYSSISLISSISNLFNLSCGAYGCYTLNMEIQSPSIGILSADCNGLYSCYSSSLLFTSNEATIGQMTLDCTASYSCYGTTIDTDTAAIGSLDIKCSASQSCYSIDVYTFISNKFDLSCLYTDSCPYAYINVSSTHSEVNMDIACNNPYITTYSSDAACYNSDIYAFGYIDSLGVQNNNLSLECGRYDCYSTEFYFEDFQDVDADCSAPYSCYYTTINADSSDQLSLICGNDYSCYSAQVWCPYRSIDACIIDCAASTYSCYSLDIYTQDSYIYDYLQISCPSEEIYDTSSCSALLFNCASGSKYAVSFLYNYTSHQYECSYATTSYCCPYFEGASITCDSGDCEIDCNDYSCANSYIDASGADYLTLTCDYQDCQYSIIYCPPGGCTIKCNDYYSCYGAQITYTGELVDEGTVSIICDDNGGSYSYPCSGLVVNADYVYNFNIEVKDYSTFTVNAAYANTINFYCHNTANDYDNVCISSVLNANYANDVTIRCKEDNACSSSAFYMNYASSVNIDVRGDTAAYSNTFYAYLVDSFTANCTSDEYDYACYSNNWFLPDNDATFNCFGTGCSSLGTMYFINNASHLQINLNACGECDNTGDCIQSFTMYCEQTIPMTVDYSNYQTWDGDDSDGTICDDGYGWDSTTTNDHQCGCEDIVNNVNYKDKSADDLCYSPTFEFDEQILVYIYIGLGIVGLFCIAFCAWCCKKCQTPPTRTPPATVTPAVNIGRPIIQKKVVAPARAPQRVVFVKTNPVITARGAVLASKLAMHHKTPSAGSGAPVPMSTDNNYASSNIGLTPLQPSVPSAPSAPSAGYVPNVPVVNYVPSVPSAPSAPGYNDDLPAYDDVNVPLNDAPPPYVPGDNREPGYHKYVSTEGGNNRNVTNM